MQLGHNVGVPSSDYEKIVESATKALHQLKEQMLLDLDVERGGFGWWHGQLDPPRIALLSEYLVSSVSGCQNSVLDASLQVETYRERRFADNDWLRRRWKAVAASASATDDDFVRATVRSAYERKRERQMRLAAEHFFYHLAQALDRLAACVIGVAALKTDIVKADWADVIRAIEVAKGEPLKKHTLDDVNTDGRAAQDQVLLAIDAARSVGPAGWLGWVLDMRNTHAHRASPMRWNMITNDESGPSGVETPFYKQPGWPEVEAMLRERGSTGSAADLLIMEEPLGLMGDLLALMSDLLAATTTALAELWSLRRSHPTLLVQPGQQWKSVFGRTLSEFEGTGARQIQMQTEGSTVRVGTELSLRLQASKVLDHDSGFWD